MIKVKRVKVERVEGPCELCVTREFTTIPAANDWLAENSLTAPDDGCYDKHDFCIEWEDGQTYDGRIDVEQGEMRLAVLLDAEGQGFDAPIFYLADLATASGDNGLKLLSQSFHLLGGHILTSHINVLIESHGITFLVSSPRSGAEPFEPGERPDGMHFEGGNTGRRVFGPAALLRATFRSAPGRKHAKAAL